MAVISGKFPGLNGCPLFSALPLTLPHTQQPGEVPAIGLQIAEN